ncbi:DNRLRE domain-containing protein [Egicoccus sp. AB-alg2]|uniref:DNRLRE domain-containing protein n=1 Tax=Egicoccus sp. AB-alg2 TaxID=3242693 RepID=UPI00359EF976
MTRRTIRLSTIVLVALLALLPLAGTAAVAADPPQAWEVVEVTATSSDGNIPENVLDGDLTTRWSAQTLDPADPEHLTVDLGSVRPVGYLGIAWHQGDQRQALFGIAVSTDGASWQTVADDRASSGEAIDLEPVAFDDVDPRDGLDARYVRYLGYGNTNSGWNSVTEVRVYAPHPDGAVVEELAGNVPQPDPDAEPYTVPGLTEPDGSPRATEAPAPTTGRSLDVTDFGADPADDGNDDAPALRAAIEAAEPGDEVVLPAGTYDLVSTMPSDRSSNVALRSGVSLRGAGPEATILRSHLSSVDGAGKVLRGYGVNDIEVSGLTVTSTFDGPFSTDHRATDAGGGPQYGIFLTDAATRPSQRVLIADVVVERFERMGVRIENSSDVVVERATFRDATGVGGGGQGYGVSIQGIPKTDRLGFPNDSRHNVVRDSTFVGPHLRHGVLLQFWTHNNLVADNTFTEIVLDAIDLHGEDEYLNEVRGNDVRDGAAAAIALGNTGGSPPSNHDASGPGNWIHGNVISGNREGIKIHMGSPDTLVERNTITGTASPDRADAILVLNAPGTVVRDNVVSGNRAPGFWGIRLAVDPGDANAGGVGAGIPTDVTITGNRVTGNTGGLWVAAGEDLTIERNVIRGNGQDVRIDETPEPEPDPDPQAEVVAPTDDSMIDNGQPTTTYGDASLLKWKQNASGSIQRLVWYRFEVDAPADVDRAVLELSAKLNATTATEPPFTFEVHAIDDTGWSEDTLTWDSAPVTTLTPATKVGEFTMAGPFEAVQRFRVDVTDAVRASTDGTVTLVVGDPAGQDANVDSYSKERGDTSLRPTLVVNR